MTSQARLDATESCQALTPNPDIAGPGVVIAVVLQTALVFIAGLVFCIGDAIAGYCSRGEIDDAVPSIPRRATTSTQHTSSRSGDSSESVPGSLSHSPPERDSDLAENNRMALGRLLFAVFDTQPIVSIAIYVAFIINATGMIDSTGELTNYHMRLAVHIQALSGIQLVIPLALVYNLTRRRQLRLAWFECHFCFFTGLSAIQIFLQRGTAQRILPFAREARCFSDHSWISLDSARLSGITTLTGYLLLVIIAAGRIVLSKIYGDREQDGTDRDSSSHRGFGLRRWYDVAFFLYLTAYAISQIVIILTLRKRYRQVWGSAEDKWGFGQVVAIVTIVPAVLDYLEAIIVGIDESVAASVIRRATSKEQFSNLYFEKLLSKLW